LFDRIETKEFDYIIINPPYFPKNPNKEEEFAWFCGNDFQYFKKLFNQIGNYVNNDYKIKLTIVMFFKVYFFLMRFLSLMQSSSPYSYDS